MLVPRSSVLVAAVAASRIDNLGVDRELEGQLGLLRWGTDQQFGWFGRQNFTVLASKDEVVLTAIPDHIASGDVVTLNWMSDGDKYTAASNDWIGYYCGSDLSKVDDQSYLDWQYVTVDSGWASGHGSETLALTSARNPFCEFRIFNHEDGSSYYRIGSSNTITVADATTAVHHLHLALTGDSGEMLVQWTAQIAGGRVEYAPEGASWDSSEVRAATGTCHTYAASDMCDTPATDPKNFIDPGQLCEAVLVGLQPDASYQYRVTADGETFSTTAVFRAAPEVDPEYSFSFLVYGDMGTWGGDSSTATAALCTKEFADPRVRMTHHFGDISYARGLASIWDTYMPIIEPYAKVAPYMVGIGNHEFDYSGTATHENDPSNDEHFGPAWFNGGSDSGGECGVPLVNRFHMPAEKSGGNGLFWHSYDFGSLHTIMLSTEHSCGEGSKQYAWLASDLAKVDRARTPWVVVEIHRPMYNNEKYLGDYNVAVGFQGQFEELLVQYDVDLVLAGHYHSYLRSKRIYKDKADPVKGIYHFTIGSAGAALDYVGLYEKDWVEVFDKDYGFGRITIANSTAMHWEYIRNKDNHDESTVVDETWILKKTSSVVV